MAQKPISFINYVFSKKNLAILGVCLLVIGYAVYDVYNAETHYESNTATWFGIIAFVIALGNIAYDSYQWYNEDLGNPNR